MESYLSNFFFPHREQKDPVYLRDKVSQKHSKEQFESAQKIEQEYSKFFTGSYPIEMSKNKQHKAQIIFPVSDKRPLCFQVLSKAAPSLTFALRS